MGLEMRCEWCKAIHGVEWARHVFPRITVYCAVCSRLMGDVSRGEVVPHRHDVSPPRKPDAVHNPPHYTQGKIQTIDVIRDWDLGFCDGNAVKYIARSKHKGERVNDLKKAVWYLNHLIQQAEEPPHA